MWHATHGRLSKPRGPRSSRIFTRQDIPHKVKTSPRRVLSRTRRHRTRKQPAANTQRLRGIIRENMFTNRRKGKCWSFGITECSQKLRAACRRVQSTGDSSDYIPAVSPSRRSKRRARQTRRTLGGCSRKMAAELFKGTSVCGTVRSLHRGDTTGHPVQEQLYFCDGTSSVVAGFLVDKCCRTHQRL